MTKLRTIWQRFYEACWECGAERPEGVECPKDEVYLCVDCTKVYEERTKEE